MPAGRNAKAHGLKATIKLTIWPKGSLGNACWTISPGKDVVLPTPRPKRPSRSNQAHPEHGMTPFGHKTPD